MDELQKLLENAGIGGRHVQFDEFQLEVEDGWVHLLDGEHTVRVSMPTDVWQGLVDSWNKQSQSPAPTLGGAVNYLNTTPEPGQNFDQEA